MDICFDHQIFSLQRHGGISRYLCELMLHLLPIADMHLHVVAPFHINEHLGRDAVLREFSQGIFLPIKFRGGAKIASSLARLTAPYLWRRRQCDIIHETYYTKQSFGSSRARILTVHDMIHELFPNEFPNSASVTAAKGVAANRADHIICVSETTKRDAIRLLGIAPQRCSVVPLGCSVPGHRMSSAAVVKTPSPYILYVGQRGGYKNFQTVLEAFAGSNTLRRQAKLIAFGGGALSNFERKCIQRFGLAQCVINVAGDDSFLQLYYRNAMAFVYPSRYEGFGMPPLEAMTLGCPVACSAAGSLPEVIGDAAAYFQSEDSTTLRSILERLMADRDYADNLRAKGRQRTQEYTWEKCAQRTLSVYRQALGLSE